MQDFNTLNSSETAYNETPVLTNIVDLFFNELEILLTTEQSDVFGQNDFGLDVQRYLWKMHVNEGKLVDVITEAVKKYCFANEYFRWEVRVQFVAGELRDIAVITFDIFDDDALLQHTKSFLFK